MATTAEIAEAAKAAGNAAFKAGNFDEAVQKFTEAIEADPTNHVSGAAARPTSALPRDPSPTLSHVHTARSGRHPPLSIAGALLKPLGRVRVEARVHEGAAGREQMHRAEERLG